MSDHLALRVDRLVAPERLESMKHVDNAWMPSSSASSSSQSCAIQIEDVHEGSGSGLEEDELLLETGECRICQEDDSIENLETPCACSGSLKFAHRKCIQQWCNEKGDINCEICHKTYQPGYTAPPPPPISEDDEIDITGVWAIAGTPFDPQDPRNIAFSATERHFLEAEYNDYAEQNANGSAFCRSAALILMALLLLRHGLSVNGGETDDEDDPSALFSIFLLRVAGFLLPCYIMAWAISIIHRRRQRQEAVALAATEVAFMIRAAQQRGLRFTVASGGALIPLQEPHQLPV